MMRSEIPTFVPTSSCSIQRSRVDPSSGTEAEVSGGIWDTSKTWARSFARALRLYGERRRSRARPYGRRRHRSLFSSRIARKRESRRRGTWKGKIGGPPRNCSKITRRTTRPAFRFSGIILWSGIFNLNFNTERCAHDPSSPCPILLPWNAIPAATMKASIRSMDVRMYCLFRLNYLRDKLSLII